MSLDTLFFSRRFLVILFQIARKLFCKADQMGLLRFDNDGSDLQKRYRYYHREQVSSVPESGYFMKRFNQ